MSPFVDPYLLSCFLKIRVKMNFNEVFDLIENKNERGDVKYKWREYSKLVAIP